MQQGSSVVGLRRETQIEDDESVENATPSPIPAPGSSSFSYRDEETAGDSGYSPSPSPWIRPAKIALVLAGVAWVGFAAYLLILRDFHLPGVEQIPAAATSVAVPLVLLGIAYLILSRSSIGEASRFARVTAQLRKEAEALDLQLAVINQQLETARQTMTDQAALLEQYGGSASANLEAAARTMAQHASTSAQQAELIERAGLALAHQFGQLIDVMPTVEERATKISATLADSSESLVERVERLEARLESLGRLLDEARTRTTNATQSMTAQLMKIQDATRSATDEVTGMADISTSRIEATLTQARKTLEETGATLDAQTSGLNDLIQQSRQALHEVSGDAVASYGANIGNIETQLRDLDKMVQDRSAAIEETGRKLSVQIEELGSEFSHLEAITLTGSERIAETLGSLAERTRQLDASLQSGNQAADHMIARAESLLIALDASIRELDEGHPAALARLDDKIDQSSRMLSRFMPEIERLETIASAVLGQARESEELLGGQGHKLKSWLDSGEASIAACREQIVELQRAMESADRDARRLADSAGPQLVATLMRVKEAADQAEDRARQALARAIADATDGLGEASEQALSDRLGSQFQIRIEEISAIADQAVKAAHAASERLMRQLITIADTTATIEQRFTEAEQAAQRREQDSFARQSAVLIESLNSAAIDIARVFAEDIDDPSWTEYLKGDRSVFTRQAVRLINAGEAASILELYEGNASFREGVNRYIHDFEAMLRTVLAQAEGTSMAVTLLSSDVGKLYVALAQATDRLKDG